MWRSVAAAAAVSQQSLRRDDFSVLTSLRSIAGGD